MPITVALTGTSGFIGRTIANQLCQAGFTVRGLARNTTALSEIHHPHLTLVKGSLNHIESLHQLVQNCTILVNCAGETRGRQKKDFFSTNVEGISNLVQVCLSQPSPPRVIHVSSLAAREPALSPYAWSKREGERIIQEHGEGLQWVILRPPAVYGPNDKALLPLFQIAKKGIALQLGSDEGNFSLIHVQDLAEVVLRSLDAKQAWSTIYEVDDGCAGGYSWESVFNIINPDLRVRLKIPATLLWLAGKGNEYLSQLFGYSPIFTTGKVAELRHPNWVCDSQPAMSQLGWTPKIPLEEGLRRLFASDSLKVLKKD